MSRTWSEENKKRYQWLFNVLSKEAEFKHLKQENYILKVNKKKLISFINKSSYSLSSKESFYFMILRWLEVNAPTDTNISMFRELAFKLKKQREDYEGENKLDDKEKENYQPREYFIRILEGIDAFIEIIADYDAFMGISEGVNAKPVEDITEHYKYLILSLLVLQPPLRTNFYITAKFTTSLKDTEKDNFVYLTQRGGKNRAYYIVNKDKVSNSGIYKTNKELSHIEIIDSKLVDILHNSYKMYPRNYLFQNKIGTGIKEETLLSYLRKITNITALNIDMMRSSYINWFYTNNKTYKARDELAKQMRNSVNTASKNYVKVSDDASLKPDELVEALKDENNELKQRALEAENKLKVFQPDTVLYKKRRSDMIYRLNLGTKPRPETLVKYAISFNKENGKYE